MCNYFFRQHSKRNDYILNHFEYLCQFQPWNRDSTEGYANNLSVVLDAISQLDSLKTSECDTKSALELGSVLPKLPNKFFGITCFPVYWNYPSLVPVFKNSGEASDPSNYRLISLYLFPANTELIKHLTSHETLSEKKTISLPFHQIYRRCVNAPH